MYATDLADICRNAGLDVVEVQGWQTRGHGGLEKVKTVVCHHTASGKSTGDMPSLRILTSGRTDLSGPLCNLGLSRTGKVYVIAAGLAYHAGAVRDTSFANAFSLGIEAENDGVGEPWPDVQVAAYGKLCAALALHYGLTEGRILGHKEVCYPPGRKIDPTLDMDALRRTVAAWMDKLREPAHAPVVPKPRDIVLRRYLKAGVSGADVAQWQRVVGSKPDGDFGPLTASATRRWQRAHGLDADGIVGRDCCRVAHWKWAA